MMAAFLPNLKGLYQDKQQAPPRRTAAFSDQGAWTAPAGHHRHTENITPLSLLKFNNLKTKKKP